MFLDLHDVRKGYDGAPVLQGIDLCLDKPGVVALLGPNGCGKTTLLNILGGLLPPDSGTVRVCGKPVDALSKGYVFQNYREALFPWKRCWDNIAYPLRLRGLNRAEQAARVDPLLELFSVDFDFRRYPHRLSGGQQQLVALLRAFVTTPDLLLLDEPFSALDFEARLSVRNHLQDLLAASHIPAVMVSHDIEDAVYLADWIVLLSRRPSHVAHVIPCTLPRPRTLEMLNGPAFTDLAAQGMAFFREVAWT